MTVSNIASISARNASSLKNCSRAAASVSGWAASSKCGMYLIVFVDKNVFCIKICLDMDEDNVILISGNNDADAAGRQNIFAFIRDKFIAAFSRRHFMDAWRGVPIDIRFRCTNRCDENCVRCFECSGPNNPLQVLPVSDIAYYQNSMKHWKGTCMTGGEWSLIYDVAPGYMLRVFDSINLRNSDVYNIQTNCRWVFGPNRDKIYSDLQKIQTKLARAGKILKLDVSVDRFRSKAALDGVRELICRVATDEHFDNTKIRIMSSRLDYCMANNTVLQPEYFKARGIPLRFEPRDLFFPFFQVFYANNKRMVIHEENPTMRIGRAAQNKIGYKIFYPEKQCGGIAGDDKFMELSFREDGTVKWHSYYDWNIIVPYKDATGRNKPIEQIKQELLQMAWRKRLRQNFSEIAWGMVPLIGYIRVTNRDRQIKKSFKQNQARITYQVREVRSH